ncbi:protamine-like [Cylas formicarius]|uniref:protamine-like n=1 Tax=Cylas formicarius TaxID=197179 RepID=UPI0029589F8A|nr:protamine-like [Cylas formicarius]
MARTRSKSRSKSGCVPVSPSVYCKARSARRSRSRRRRSRRLRTSRRIRRSRRGRSRRRSRRSRRRRGRSRRRCARPGPKTTNPFLNFLRVFRRRHCGWPQIKIAIEGAKTWCQMNKQQRHKFYREACSARKKKGRGRRGRSRRRRGRSRRR